MARSVMHLWIIAFFVVACGSEPAAHQGETGRAAKKGGKETGGDLGNEGDVDGNGDAVAREGGRSGGRGAGSGDAEGDGVGGATGGGGAYAVLSDLDDTIKITNTVSGGIGKIFGALTGKTTFGGMNALTSELVQGGGKVPFFVLSGSPGFLGGSITEMLANRGFPSPTAVLLRDGVGGSDGVGAYKVEKLRQVMQQISEPLVLLGDDTDQDPEAYTQIAGEAAGRVAAIYIHRVRGQNLSGPVRMYTTAFEVAVWEMAAGRLDEAQVQKIGQEVLAAPAAEVVPDFAACPSLPLSLQTGSQALEALKGRIDQLLASICSGRG